MNRFEFLLSSYIFKLGIACLLAIITIFSLNRLVAPASMAMAKNTVNPLTVDVREPILPEGYERRELTSFEKYRLRKKSEQLQTDADTKYKTGNVDRAFELWYRQLRLTRILDSQEEIASLGKIGAIAWQENRRQDLRNIGERLSIIQQEIVSQEIETQARSSLPLLDELATSYQKVRYLDKGIEVYQWILDNYAESLAKQETEELRDSLADLYLRIFDYQNAALLYQEISQENVSPEDKESYLVKSIAIYDRGGWSDRAIANRAKLIELYRTTEQQQKIPALKIANARDLATEGKLDRAIASYRSGFSLAKDLGQLALASEALQEMAQLQQKQNKLSQAIDNYQQLLAIYEQTNNYYDAIFVCDRLGEIYLETEEDRKAQITFARGLAAAKILDYKVNYFQQKLKELKSKPD